MEELRIFLFLSFLLAIGLLWFGSWLNQNIWRTLEKREEWILKKVEEEIERRGIFRRFGRSRFLLWIVFFILVITFVSVALVTTFLVITPFAIGIFLIWLVLSTIA